MIGSGHAGSLLHGMINRALNPEPDLILTKGAKMPSNQMGGRSIYLTLRSAERVPIFNN
jgi:hypothetical protein